MRARRCKTDNSCGNYWDGILWDDYFWDTCTACADICASCTSEAQPATQRCASCDSGATMTGNGVCTWTVTPNINGCYIDSNCQGACGATGQCVDKSGFFETCYGVGNAGGWNKYTCVPRPFSDKTCGGACAPTAGCKQSGGLLDSNWYCTEPSCGAGQYASGGECYAPAPPAPPGPTSCP